MRDVGAEVSGSNHRVALDPQLPSCPSSFYGSMPSLSLSLSPYLPCFSFLYIGLAISLRLLSPLLKKYIHIYLPLLQKKRKYLRSLASSFSIPQT